VFQTIRFRFRNPIDADRAVIAFMRHLEAQPLAQWNVERETPPPVPARLPVTQRERGRNVG
jgi:hypothetical protein